MDGELKALLIASGILLVAACLAQVLVPGGVMGLRDFLVK